MSSNQTHRPTFWCHDCDMSVHLLPSAVSSTALCPLCHSQNLELMDDPSPTPSTDTTVTSFLDSPSFRRFFLPFFGDFSPSDDSDSDSLSLFDSILPTIKISSALLDDEPESELICAICKEEFVVDVEAKLLPCDHLFHPECILPWLDSDHNSCPLCRFEIPSGSKLGDVCCSESSSNFALGDSIVRDEVDCGFPDVGVLSSFLPSHF